ncbi:octopamine receptor [Plakobranchus ocellatus]|uniref:Octopamine receptor n=1 Tax=Plakobranchus ocellatus TaxID=259542 RepID=A0AAV3ZIK2_9GAST|nr:octopamine receptor [Plakobranchus ocellatus]
MFSSTLVACDRYIFIRYPLRYDTLVTRERSVAWIVIAWCLAVAYGCVPLYWNNFMSSEGCTPTHIFGYEYMIIFHPFMFLSLSILIFTLYFKISKTALQHNRRINAQNVVLQDRSSSIANGSISEAKHSKFSSDTSENTCLNNNKPKSSIQKNQVQFKVKEEHQQIATPTTRQSSYPRNESETGTTQVVQIEDIKNTQPQRQEQQEEQQQHLKTLEQHEPNNKNHLQSGPTFTRSLSRSTLKMIKMLIFVFGLFFLSWCPLLVVGYLEYTVHVSHLALSLAGLTGVLNSGINCLVLVVMNKDFRREYQSLFCWCFIRK